MKRLLLACLLISSAIAQTPAGKEQPLTAVKGSILIPEGWHFQEEAEDGVFIYYVTREKVDNNSFTAGLVLTVTTKVQERAEESPSQYAADLLPSPEEPGGTEVKKTDEGPYKVLRAGYSLENDHGNVLVVNLAKANDATNTLYFLTWQSPEGEENKLKDVRDAIFSSLKLDPAF